MKKMDYAHHRLTPEIYERNIELVAALSQLPPLEACQKLEAIGRGIDEPDSTAPKVTRGDFKAIQDAFGLVPFYEMQKPL